MPSWITHLVTANKVLQRVNIQKDEFVFGNIMPDILNGFTVKVENSLHYCITHFAKTVEINGIELQIPDIQRFKQEYKKSFKNPVICGFFVHLLTDYFWNEYVYKNYFEIYDKQSNVVKLKYINGEKKILNWDNSVREKQKDFSLFAKYLYRELELNISIDSTKILEYSKEIKELYFTRQDIENTILYLNNIKDFMTESKDYKIFSKKEMEQKLTESIEFIMENLEQ